MAQVKQTNNSFHVRQLPDRADPGSHKDRMRFTCSHFVLINYTRELRGEARSRARCRPQPRHPRPLTAERKQEGQPEIKDHPPFLPPQALSANFDAAQSALLYH